MAFASAGAPYAGAILSILLGSESKGPSDRLTASGHPACLCPIEPSLQTRDRPQRPLSWGSHTCCGARAPDGLAQSCTHRRASRADARQGNSSLSKKLYVGNLPFSTTDDDLRRLFESHGGVDSARVITDRETGRSRGFGFVEMADAQAAETAMRALDGNEHGGRNLKVNEAQERR